MPDHLAPDVLNEIVTPFIDREFGEQLSEGDPAAKQVVNGLKHLFEAI
jgi:hypothetical protein